MKTLVLYLSSCLLIFGVNAQHDHSLIEEIFEGKSLHDFENHIGLSQTDYSNTLLMDFIDSSYQDFHSEVHDLIDQPVKVNLHQIETDYDALVLDVKGQLNLWKPGKPLGSSKAADGPCENMDFETGDLTGWTLTRGNVTGAVPFSYAGEFAVGPGAYHTVFGGGIDPVTGIPRVDPLVGNFSVRLGNGTGVGARAARMKQTFLVDPTNYMFTYSYAVVFESPAGHSLNQLPYFTVRVFDSLGNSIPCGEYSVIADAANAPNYQTTTWGGTTVLYKNWETVFTNLSAYIGQNVTIEFTSGDCSLTGHFGYAYVDASCGVDQLTASNNIICTGDSAVLTAPPGASSYLWSNGGTNQTTTVYTGGTYSCTITPYQGGGCDITLDIIITEYPSPTANFSGPASMCLGGTTGFSDLSSIPAPGVITGYRWDFGDGIVTPISSGAITGVNNTTGTYLAPNHDYATPGVYNVQLYVETADGCADSLVIPLTIYALPAVVAGPDYTICEGTTVTLAGAGADAYVWDNGVVDGVPFTPAVGTVVYTVVGTDINGCQNSDQVTVTVNPIPTVNAGPDQVICDGSLITLIGAGIAGAGAGTYVWDNNVINNIPFTQGIGSVTYTVTGTDQNGCSATDQVDVTVNPLPTVVANVDQTAVCLGETITLTGSGAQVYSWDNGVTDGVPFVPVAGTTTYTVVGTDGNGCQNSDQITVQVFGLPTVVAGQDQEVCSGDFVTLSGSGAVSYAWNNGVIDNTPFLPPLGTTQYVVTGTDANGCQNTDQVAVTVNSLPTVNAGPDQNVCDGAQVTLIASGISGAGAGSYVWDNNVINNVPFTQGVGSVTYTVIGTDLNGCSATDQVNVVVNDLPAVVANASNTVVCEGESVVLFGSGALNYTWSGGVLDNVPFTPTAGVTDYTVTGTDDNGCSNTDQITITVNSLPVVVAGPDQEVCDGDSLVLLASGATNYSWSNGVVNGVPFTQPIGTMIYTVTGTDANGCINVDQATITVNPLPDVNAGVDLHGCEGGWITLSAAGSPNLYWSNGVTNNVSFQQSVGVMTYIVYDSLATGCTNSDTVEVEVTGTPVITTQDKEVCIGEGVVLNGQGGVSYEWSGGIIDSVEFFPTGSSSYTVTGTDMYGCFSQAVAEVTVHKAPVVDFKILNLSLTTTNATTGFDNLTTGAVSYEWNFGDGSPLSNLFEPTHTFPEDQSGEYTIKLTAYSEHGCPAERIKYVHVFSDYTIYVPNAFTPDANGVNEVFKPVLQGFDEQDYTLYVFNRWGDLIFESHDMEVGWDGTFAKGNYKVQDGVYVWKIIAGLKESSDTKIFVGHVSLLK